MTTRQKLHRAIDQLSDEQVQKVIQVIEVIQADITLPHRRVNLARYSGVLQLGEDPLAYQDRIRNEWP
jgi:hypothetical protein